MGGFVEVELEDVLGGLTAMQAAGRDLRPVFKELRPLVRADLKQHFADEAAPESAWPGPSRATLEKILAKRGSMSKKGKGLLRRGARRLERAMKNPLGRLKSAWAFSVGPRFLEARSKAPWSGVHQEGGTAGHGAHIPQRTFAWFSEALIERFVDLTRAHLEAAW